MIGSFALLTAIALGIWGLWLVWVRPDSKLGKFLAEFFAINVPSKPPASDTPTQEAPGEEPHGD